MHKRSLTMDFIDKKYLKCRLRRLKHIKNNIPAIEWKRMKTIFLVNKQERSINSIKNEINALK